MLLFHFLVFKNLKQIYEVPTGHFGLLLQFLSWNYDDSRQKLEFLNRSSKPEIDLSAYQKSPEWELIGQEAFKYHK